MGNFEYKPVRVNDSEKVKIKEMAEKLFPEYNTVQFENHDADNLFVILTNMEERIFIPGKVSIGGHKFHWFELMSFISKRLSGGNLFEKHVANGDSELSLVEYIYEQFESTCLEKE